MKKRMLALLMVLGMTASLLAGCGNSENAGGGTPPTDGADAGDTGDTGDADEAGDDEDFDDEEMAEIVVALMCFAPMDESATDPVEEAINELTEANINVHVDIQWYDASTYGEQVPRMIQAAEKLDLMMYTPVPSASYAGFMNAGQLADITSLLDEYGPTIKATLGDYLDAVSMNGAIYGVPNSGAKASAQQIFMREDILEQVGMLEAAQNASTWADVEEIYKAVAEQTDLAPVVNSDAEGTTLYPRPFMDPGESFADAFMYDNLGDGFNLIYADPATNEVKCYYLSDEYKEMIERVCNWYKEGLIYKDAMTAQDYADTLVKSEVGFSTVRQSEVGSKESSEAMTGFPITLVKITDGIISTSSCTKFGFAVPVTAKEDAAAIKFLNYMYESSEIENLLTWGVEGRDWTLNADGMATYPDGVTAETVAYHTADFLYGDQFLVTPWEGGATDIRDQQKAENAACEISPFMGFSVDPTNLQNELSQCSMIATQYHPALDSGSSTDWEGDLAKFQEELKASGIDKILEEYQAQLDAWLATQ